jgi:uncharacterized membrane protein
MSQAPSTGALPRARWLLSETHRSWVSAGIATVVTFLAVLLLSTWLPGVSAIAPVLAFVLAWALLAGTHSVLSWRAFRRLEGAALSAAVRTDRASMVGARGAGGDGPAWSVQVSILAVLVVGALVVVPGLRSHPVLLGAAVVMVAASWIDVAVMYAVHYARMDASTGALHFSGTEERSFFDYLYLSLAIQTTFGATDVTPTDRQSRRTVMTHGLLAFVFNTIIIAVVVSLLLGVA